MSTHLVRCVLLQVFFSLSNLFELFAHTFTVDKPSFHIVLHLCYVLHADRKLCDLNVEYVEEWIGKHHHHSTVNNHEGLDSEYSYIHGR